MCGGAGSSGDPPSDWESWGEVSTWAQGLFKAPPAGRRFREVSERLRALPEAQRLRAAVRFAQDEVRYVGVELGTNSHQPHSPEWVLERGFGDCKDKTLLLVSLLRALGFEAWPAVANSWKGEGLRGELPSGGAFNHAIAKVRLPNGDRFIDSSWTNRRGDPARWGLPV